MTGISVYVRIKPSDTEDPSLVKISPNELEINSRSVKHSFLFDSILDQNIPQRDVYEATGKTLLNEALNGYNCTLLAYGQTCSGKTHTIFGSDHSRGIVPRIFEDLSNILGKQSENHISIRMSYYEIYKEKIVDLLCSNANKKYLKVGEDPKRGPYVKGLTYVNVENLPEAMSSFRTSYDRRSVCSTNMNERSSRSHCIFSLYFTISRNLKIDSNVVHEVKNSQFNIVDLAGSELFSDIDQNDQSKLRECIMINKSLFTLGKVISQLSKIQYKDISYTPLSKYVQMTPRKMSKHVSYRDSVLTWLLKESLGGNSKTTLIATVNALPIHSDESLRTLRYAQKAHSIVNIPTVNEDDRCRLIKDLIKEINRLKMELSHASSPRSPYQKSITHLKQELDLRNNIIEQLTQQLKLSRFSIQSYSSTNISEDDTESLRSTSGDYLEIANSKTCFYNEDNYYIDNNVNTEQIETPKIRNSIVSDISSPTNHQVNEMKTNSSISRRTQSHNLFDDDSIFIKPLSPLQPIYPTVLKECVSVSIQTDDISLRVMMDKTTLTDQIVHQNTCISPIRDPEDNKENKDEALRNARISKNTNYAYKVLYQDVCKKNIDLNEANMVQEWENKELKAKLTRCERELECSAKCIEVLESKIGIYQKLLEAASATREELLFKTSKESI